MKNLKVKFGLFSLLAILAVSVFLTSCEQDRLSLPTDDIQKSEIPAAAQYLIEEDREITFNLPAGFDDADEETIELYLTNMTAEQMQEMEESYKIEEYLESINRAEEVYNDLGQTDMLTLSDLSKYTSEQELADFNSFDVNSVIESRAWCSNWTTKCEYLGTWNGYHLYRKRTTRYCCSISWSGQSCGWRTTYGPITSGGC